MAHIGISSCHRQTVKDAFHVCIIGISPVIYLQQAVIVHIPPRLVKDAQHHIQPIVDMTMQTGYLNNDAVVRQTVDKRIRQALCHNVVIVVKRLVAYIEHRLLHITNLVTQQIDGYHRQTTTRVQHILRIRIMHAKILTETQSLRVKPSLLQFNQNKMLLAVGLTDSCTEVDAED